MGKNKSFWVAVFAGFIVLTAGDIVIHQVWLKETYQGLAQFWRSPEEMKAKAWVPFLASFALAFLLAEIYPKGFEGKSPTGEGLRFGLLMGLLLFLPSILMKYFVYPFPNSLLVAWFIGGMAQVTLAGLAIGLAYKKGK